MRLAPSILLLITACSDAPETPDPLLGFECRQHDTFPELAGCGGVLASGMFEGICVGEPERDAKSTAGTIGVCRPWRPAACRVDPEQCAVLGGVGMWTARGACVCVPE